MVFSRIGLVMVGLVVCALLSARANASLILSPDGQTVYDTSTGLNWLANGDLPAIMPLGLSCQNGNTSGCILSNGSMDYATSVSWIGALNAINYEGRDNWQLPATASYDGGCSATGAMGNSFAYNCYQNALGALYHNSLGLSAPAPAMAPAVSTVGPFSNFQPNFYWSKTAEPASNNGYLAFSFASGNRDTIVGTEAVDPHTGLIKNFGGTNLNVLPMAPGTPNPSLTGLQLINSGQVVFDPATGDSWAANANLAASFAASASLMLSIGMTVCSGPLAPGGTTAPICINPDGTMNWPSADAFVTALNAIAYAGISNWTLPPETTFGCLGQACSSVTKNPMAYLYYNELGYAEGAFPITPGTSIDPFYNLEPEYYWSCEAVNDQNAITAGCSYPSNLPSVTQGWDYSMNEGYLSTDNLDQPFFVIAESVSVPEPSSLALLGAGLAGLGFARRRRRA